MAERVTVQSGEILDVDLALLPDDKDGGENATADDGLMIAAAVSLSLGMRRPPSRWVTPRPGCLSWEALPPHWASGAAEP